MTSYDIDRNGSKVHLIGIVKGLVSEAERLEDIVKDLKFEVGALPISKGEVEGLREFTDQDEIDTEVEPSTPEKIYAEKLEKFGDVSLPPPSYTFFLRYCSERGIDIEALDMDEEHYTMAYCDHVTGLQWIRQSLREKRLDRKSIEADEPEEFAKKWDQTINKLKGFQKLEEHRERIMAKNIDRLAKRGDMVGIIQEERIEGVLDQLEE